MISPSLYFLHTLTQIYSMEISSMLSKSWTIWLLLFTFTKVSDEKNFYRRIDENLEVLGPEILEKKWTTWANRRIGCQMACGRIDSENVGLENILVFKFVPRTGRCECFKATKIPDATRSFSNTSNRRVVFLIEREYFYPSPYDLACKSYHAYKTIIQTKQVMLMQLISCFLFYGSVCMHHLELFKNS